MTDQVNEYPNREQEAALIGAILRRPSIYQDIAEIVTGAAFEWRSYSKAWMAISGLTEAGMTPDTLTVGDELLRMNALDDFATHDSRHFGRGALAELRQTGQPAAAETYAEIVADYAAKRELRELFSQGAYWAANGRRSADISADIARRLDEIRTPGGGKERRHTATLKEALSEAYDQTEAAAAGKTPILHTGYKDLDFILSGMSGGDLVTFAARPGQGKTALLCSIADNLLREGKRILFFTLEMPRRQIAMRMIAMRSGVGTDKQRTGKLTDEDWPMYTHALGELEDLPLTINDLSGISPAVMRGIGRRNPADVWMLDYLQLATADGLRKNDSRTIEVGRVTAALKSLAKEFDLPILTAAQLNRESENRAEPTLRDLGESGKIEQDSDSVIFIWRKDDTDTVTNVKVAKNRHGQTGKTQLVFLPHKTRFESMKAEPAQHYSGDD